MIKKIVDWTAGSFFRTIGRLLVFVIIGFLVAKLVDFSNIKWTDLLGIETIKAMSLDGIYYGQKKVADNQWSNTFYRTSSYDFSKRGYTFGTPFNSGDADYVQFNLLSWLYVEDINTFQEHYGNSGSGTYTYQFSNENHYLVLPRIQLMSNGAWQTCELQNNLIVCPTFHNVTYTGLYIEIDIPTDSTSQRAGWYLTVNNYCNLYTTATNSIIQSQENNTQSIINSQTQQHNETMSYFQDSNTTSTEEEASSFFEDFSVTDHGGLSSILTAPLTIVSKVLDDTCTPATFTYRNKQVVLPCGQYFWNQAPELRDWLSTIESGIIAYAILVALFKMIQRLESPSNSEVEVESL